MKKILVLVLVGLLIFSSFAFAGDGFLPKDGRDTFENTTARLEKGFYYPDFFLVMKWSKGWIPQAKQEKGEWLTNHWEWYNDEFEVDSWQGNVGFEEGSYRIEEFIKMVAISDEEVQFYVDNGHYVIWGNILVLTDEITIYDVETGEMVDQFYVDPTNENWGMKIDGAAYDLNQGIGYWKK